MITRRKPRKGVGSEEERRRGRGQGHGGSKEREGGERKDGCWDERTRKDGEEGVEVPVGHGYNGQAVKKIMTTYRLVERPQGVSTGRCSARRSSEATSAARPRALASERRDLWAMPSAAMIAPASVDFPMGLLVSGPFPRKTPLHFSNSQCTNHMANGWPSSPKKVTRTFVFFRPSLRLTSGCHTALSWASLPDCLHPCLQPARPTLELGYHSPSLMIQD